jgi:hypothetical protein
MSKVCDKILCPSDQVATTDIDRCECRPRPPVVGDPTGTHCAALGRVIRCEEGTTCVCGDKGYGDAPFNDPACLNDPTTYPGSLERITTPTPERVFVFTDPRTPDDRFIGLRDDSPTASRVTSAVLPPLYRNTVESVGTGVTTRLVTTETTVSGVFQLFLHNPANNVHHEFVDQCELQTLAAGQPTLCNLTPDNTQRRGAWEACLRSGGCAMEFTTQGTPVLYDGVVGFTVPLFVGTPSLTAGVRPQQCPPPGPVPDLYVRTVNPLWDLLGGTPEQPIVDLPLGSGDRARLNPTLPSFNPDMIQRLRLQ